MWLLVGCAREAPDPWTEARDACGLEEPLDWALLAADGEIHEVVVPGDCADRLVADLGGDPGELMEALGAEGTLGERLEAERLGLAPHTGLGLVVRGAYWLLGSDLGRVDELEEGPYVSARWVEEYQQLAAEQELPDDAPLSQILYDHVADRFKRLALLPQRAPDTAGAGTRWMSRKLLVPAELPPLDWTVDHTNPMDGTHTLVHEAAHARFGGLRHVDCEDGARFCDEDLDGAHGAGFAAAWAQARVAKRGLDCLDDSPGARAARFAEDTIQSQWDFVLAEIPERSLSSCD